MFLTNVKELQSKVNGHYMADRNHFVVRQIFWFNVKVNTKMEHDVALIQTFG